MKHDSSPSVPRWHWLYPILVCTVIVYASGNGNIATPGIVDFDKVAHFSVFGLISSLVTRLLPRRAWFWAIVIVSLFGATDEWHQGTTPGRSMEVDDWIADTLGAAVAAAAYTFWPAYRRLLETPLWKRGARTTADVATALADATVSGNS